MAARQKGRWAAAMAGGVVILAALVLAHRRRRPLDAAVTVSGSRPAVYRVWRDLTNLPELFPAIERVEAKGSSARITFKERRRTWVAVVEEDRQDERITLRAVPPSRRDARGTVFFRDAPGGATEIRLVFDRTLPRALRSAARDLALLARLVEAACAGTLRRSAA